MQKKNKYIYRSKLSEAKFREIVRYFSLDIEANKAAVLASLNRNTLNRYYNLVRRCVTQYCEYKGCHLGFVEKAVSGENHQVGDEGCYSVESGSMVFGVCLIAGWIYTEIIHETDLPEDRNMLVSRNGVECYLRDCPNPRIKEYRALVDFDSGRYVRTSHSGEDKGRAVDVKSCDLFWGYAKSRLLKFNGISKSTLYFHIKECEFRYNHRGEDLYKLLLKIIRENPIN